jgi:hypothetical protein
MKSRIIASLLVVFAGSNLLLDKFIDFKFENNFGFYDSATLIWTVTQSICPILICFASAFKPFKISYTIPIYVYTIQLYWTFTSANSDREYMYLYCTGTVFLFFLAVFLYSKYLEIEKEKDLKIELYEALLDLSHKIMFNEK